MALIKIEIKNLEAIIAGFNQASALMTKNLNIAIKKVLFVIRAYSVEEAPVKTGYLRSSAYQKYKPLQGEFGFKAKYALFVHDGTDPYIIIPSKKKALFWEGASHPVRMVHHPGIRANPFLKRAIDRNEPTIDKFFKEAVDNTLEEIAKKAK